VDRRFGPVLLATITVLAGLRPSQVHATTLFEVYPSERPDDADRVMGLVRRALTQTLVDPVVVMQVHETELPLPGVTDPSVTVAKIRETFEGAFTLWAKRQQNADEALKAALEGYQRGFQLVRENQATVVRDSTLAQWLTEAYAGYAMAYVRANDRDSARYQMGEQMRAFSSEQRVTTKDNGPDAVTLYEEVLKEEEAKPRGTVLVTVNNASARIYIHGVARGRGGTLTAKLTAGQYPVLISVGNIARRYLVPHDPAKSANTELNVEWTIDSHFFASPRWIGFENITHTTAATALARWLTTDSFELVSIVAKGDTRFLVGTAHALGSVKERVRCETSVEGVEARIDDFVVCLKTGRHTEGVTDGSGDVVRTRKTAGPSLRTPLVTIYAGAAIAFGGAYIKQTTNNGCASSNGCPNYGTRRIIGYSGVAAGAAVMGLGLYLLFRATPWPSTTAVSAGPSPNGGAMITIGGAF